MAKKSNIVRRNRRTTSQNAPDKYRKWYYIIPGGLVLLVVGLFSLSYLGASETISDVINFGRPARGHIDGVVEYGQIPPVGGEHSPVWQNCGIYDQPIVNENAVHSLEHGAVWITYSPDLPAGDVDILRGLVRGRSHALLSPYEGLPTPVVASAWGLQLQVESATDERLPQFVARYMEGPQTPEPGASCSGGVGEPIG